MRVCSLALKVDVCACTDALKFVLDLLAAVWQLYGGPLESWLHKNNDMKQPDCRKQL